MRRMRFSPRSSFARTLLLIVTLLFVSLVTTYLVVLNFAILPSLQQFNKVLAYEVRMLMTDKLQLEDGTQLVVPPAFRREIYRELGISLYTNEAAEEAGLRWAQHYEFLSHQMAQQLGGPTEVRVEVNKSSPVVWLKTWAVAQYLGARAADRDSSGRFFSAFPLHAGDHAPGDRRRVAVYSYTESTVSGS
ncbi:two-component sensor kinase EnvZ [Salmonella enterica subsp. enterica serovar Typhimurium]|nr:two-component sensor kinase EnvZ [Salmonella enterica subsp. enterica serovar Typhimurium]